jgi:cyclohexanone monooxygenase
MKAAEQALPTIDVAVVGAGIAGLYALHKLRGLGFVTTVFEAGAGVGGTWYWNRYPGARCDVESFQYSYSFCEELQQEWNWTERFAAQPEIRSYLDHVADRFDLRRDIRLNCRIVSATYLPDDRLWSLITADGDTILARFCVMATGVLSKPRDIHFPGQESFGGTIISTAHWPEAEPDLSGKRIALIGTGASGSQAMPHLLDHAAELTVFQRTPNFSIPTANAKVDETYGRHWKDNYAAHRHRQATSSIAVLFDDNPKSVNDATPDERRAEFERRWNEDGGLNFMRAFNDLQSNEQANGLAADFVRDKIRTIVRDPETARKLMPPAYPLDSRRIATTDRDFYDFFNRSNVKLVSMLDEPIVRIDERGIVTSASTYPADVIIMATGFDAMTGALTAIDICGVGGVSLRSLWRDRPASYLGLTIAGFPNLFMVNGPGSTGPLANLFTSSEMIVDWIAACVDYLRANAIDEIAARGDMQQAWMAHVDALSLKTLMVKAPSSSYFMTNSNNERIFLCYSGGYANYTAILDNIAHEKYDKFDLTQACPASWTATRARSESKGG